MNSLRIETRALPFFVFAIIMFFGFYSKPMYAAMVLGEESQKEESEERKDETSESSEKREDEKSEREPIQEKVVPVTEEVIIPSEEKFKQYLMEF
ncbi:MAG: hypothetical protein IPN70_03140 [Candidatus Moraniibacteriota bacterium]|nr:MAG: hypothetical protein IPN70_03140 [Candidatus Moranbacteria bacterium]